MWVLDSDPRLASAFANLTILDRAPDRDELRTRMLAATAVVPRLRQKVVDGAPLSTPAWIDDADFDIDHHLRWIHLGPNDLDSVVADLSSRPFDRSRPLWEFVVIDGLPDGAAAMVQRMDHTLTDGEGGIRLSVQFLDLERHPERREPPAPTARPGRTDRSGTTDSNTTDSADDPAPGLVDQATRGLRAAANMPSALFDIVRDSVQQLATPGRRSSLWTERSTERWFGRSTINLEDAKSAAHQLGGSVNDLFVTGALQAAARIHSAADAPVDELRVAIPLSQRSSGTAGGNAFTPAMALLPAGPMDVTERFAQVHERLDRVKASRGSMGLEGPATVARLLPDSALVGIVGRSAGAIDFVCSNVRAAPFDLYIAGAHLEANYPLGPLVNTAFNLTTMSYRGWLFLGLLVDRAAVADPDALLAAVDDAYSELLAAGGIGTRRTPDLSVTI